MKRLLIALATTVFCGGYMLWCLILMSSVISAMYNSPNAPSNIALIGIVITVTFLVRFALSRPARNELNRRTIKTVILLTLLAIGLWIPWTPPTITWIVSMLTLVGTVRVFYVQMKMPSL